MQVSDVQHPARESAGDDVGPFLGAERRQPVRLGVAHQDHGAADGQRCEEAGQGAVPCAGVGGAEQPARAAQPERVRTSRSAVS